MVSYVPCGKFDIFVFDVATQATSVRKIALEICVCVCVSLSLSLSLSLSIYIYIYIYIYMVKDHSNSERGNLLAPHRLLFLISSKGFLHMHHPTDRIGHTMAFVTPVVEHWLGKMQSMHACRYPISSVVWRIDIQRLQSANHDTTRNCRSSM